MLCGAYGRNWAGISEYNSMGDEARCRIFPVREARCIGTPLGKFSLDSTILYCFICIKSGARSGRHAVLDLYGPSLTFHNGGPVDVSPAHTQVNTVRA